MKSWKTTLAGLVAGLPMLIDALITAYNAGTFTGKTGTQTLASVGIVILGFIAKDHNVTGGTVAKILLPIVLLLSMTVAGNAQSLLHSLPPYKVQTAGRAHAIGITDTLPSLSANKWNGWRLGGPDIMLAIPDFTAYTGVGIDYVWATANTSTGKWNYDYTVGARLIGGANLSAPKGVQTVGGFGLRVTLFNGLLALGGIYNLTLKHAQAAVGNPAALIPGLN